MDWADLALPGNETLNGGTIGQGLLPGAIERLESALDEIRRARRLIEDTFVETGGRLETSIGSLEALTTTFKRLQEELASTEMLAATDALSGVARQIVALTQRPDQSGDMLGRITGLTRGIAQRVTRMRKAVKAVDVLAVNAKIAAAHLGAGGEGFASFAEEITRAMSTAEENLDRFAGALTHMSENIDEASASQRELHLRQEQAIRVIPDQLARSVAAISDRRRQAAKTAEAIQQKTLRIAQRIGGAVMAMQIGDTTRQRIEHAELALDLAGRLLGRDGQTDALSTFDCTEIRAETQADLFDGVCALQVAQLVDTAQDLDGQIGAITGSLGELAADAREIVRLGQQTFASGDTRSASFLSDLQQDVTEAGGLMESLRTAQATGDEVLSAVLETSRALVQNISTIQSLEVEIRLMGLNTTLRSSRLGSEGRALTIIAQELRTCSNLTAEEAGAVMTDLDAMVTAAGAARSASTDQELQSITELAQTMTSSVAALSKLADSLADALGLLSRASDTVVAALEQTATEIKVNTEIAAILRRAAERLDALSDGRDKLTTADPDHPLLKVLTASYTMAREREIHVRILGGSLPAVTAPAAAATDDIFF